MDRPVHGLYAQLGIFPENLKVDAVELSIRTGEEDFRFHHPELKGTSLIRNSDAHFVPDIGKNEFGYLLESRTFREAWYGIPGRSRAKGGAAMKELALHLLDVAENGIRAGAKHIGIGWKTTLPKTG
ncbi:MAG: hypothetical protein R2751_01675 [Bacteroidales bacterium]